MIEVKVDGLIASSDELTALDEEELNQLNFYSGEKGVCLKNEDEHVMISIGHKRVNRLAAVLLTGRDLIRRTQDDIARAMKPYGYRLLGYRTGNAGGLAAGSFDYQYEVDGIKMYGETMTARRGGDLYYLYLYVREENKEAGLRIWKGLTESLKWETE